MVDSLRKLYLQKKKKTFLDYCAKFDWVDILHLYISIYSIVIYHFSPNKKSRVERKILMFYNPLYFLKQFQTANNSTFRQSFQFILNISDIDSRISQLTSGCYLPILQISVISDVKKCFSSLGKTYCTCTMFMR